MAKIMVVEDEGLVALQIKEGLENMEYEVPCLTASGEECIELVMAHKPDLVLMDIHLKGKMTGIEAARLIRDNFFIPVIFLTAYSDSQTLDEAKLVEAYGYVLKPFEEKALKANIEVALYKAQRERLLRNNNDWYSIISRSTGEAVIICDTSGLVKYINEIATELTQWEAEEIYESPLQEVFQTYDQKTGVPKPPEFRTTLSEGSILDFTGSLLKTRNGSKISIDYTVAPLKNKNGSTMGVIIIFKHNSGDQNKENTIQIKVERPLQIQKNFLPDKNRDIPGIRADYLFLPNMFGSGDIFNYFLLDKDHFGFYMLDVMGHGFSAAMVAITLNRLLLPDIQSGGILKQHPEKPSRKKNEEAGLPPFILHPEEVVQQLNQRFLFEHNQSPFFTFIYGIINIPAQKCLLVRAGHTPPLLQHEDGSIESVEANGPAIGVIPEINVQAENFSFVPGKRLFLYSDGLVESRNSKQEQYGTERLLPFLERYRAHELPVLIKNLEQEILAWRDLKKFDDDIAFAAIELSGIPW